jgi:hypothetical protein
VGRVITTLPIVALSSRSGELWACVGPRFPGARRLNVPVTSETPGGLPGLGSGLPAGLLSRTPRA